MRTTETFYSVQITGCLKPTKRLVVHPILSAGPRFFFWRKPAIELKRALIAEGFKSAKVVKVKATFIW